MPKKGVVVMTSINLQTQSSLYYSHVVLNDQTVKNTTSYNKILQTRLDSFNELIRRFFPKVINFYNDYFKTKKENKKCDFQYELELLAEILGVYKNEWKDKVPTLNVMSEELNEKTMDKKTFEYLLKIITHQEKITREILNKELTIDRVEIVFNHLQEVPHYLKSDLEINKLPKSKTRETTIGKKRSIIARTYNIKSDGGIYHIGA